MEIPSFVPIWYKRYHRGYHQLQSGGRIMPRKFVLTWQPGSGQRRGRWRKRYRGQVLYFPFGTCKTDSEGYRQAMDAWKQRKTEIDADELITPRRHEADYKSAIQEWTLALQVSVEADDAAFAQLARQKIEELKARLISGKQSALQFYDHLLNQWSWPPEVLAEIGAAFNAIQPRSESVAGTQSLMTCNGANDLDGSPRRIRQEIWKDRLAVQQAKGRLTKTTLEGAVEQFLTCKRAKVDAGELSAGRFDPLRGHLHHFRDWLGGALAVEAISGKVLTDYHGELLAAINKKIWSSDYAKDRMNAVKGFVQWLWQIEAIEQLPRVLTQKGTLTIGKRIATPAVFTIDEVQTLLTAATNRTRLYLLLMLNTGMLQKDISDLKVDEVDWKRGTVTRKRSKTQHHASVPTVTYKLWPQTFALLQQERAASGDKVLVNQDGQPLKVENLMEDGKLRKIDNISSAYNRLRREKGMTKALKLLRKTSASLLRGSQRFNGIEDLFLGHSPRSMSDRHYAQVPQKLLDRAIEWLGEQYDLGKLPTVKPAA